MKKIVTGILVGVILLICGLYALVQLTWQKRYDAPLPDITASTDSAVIARGRYLAQGPAHCSSCHTPIENYLNGTFDVTAPLIGGWGLNIPPGSFHAPNLTPDPETGIGRLSDAQIARALRYSVKHDGSLLFPFMPFQNLSDDDLTAIVSFLRSQEPVHHEVPKTSYTFLGKAILAAGMLKPEGPRSQPPRSVQIDSSASYGAYLANSVANCVGCHTNRDMKTGKFLGEPFSGGLVFKAEDDPELSKGYSYVSPNLTPDPETGILVNYNQDAFVMRFKAGRALETSPMPWESYAHMEESDIKALYQYLNSLPPVRHPVEKTVYPPGEPIAAR